MTTKNKGGNQKNPNMGGQNDRNDTPEKRGNRQQGGGNMGGGQGQGNQGGQRSGQQVGTGGGRHQ